MDRSKKTADMLATQSKGLHPSLSSGLLSPIHVRKPHSFLAVINHHINGIIANRMIWITLVIALEIHKFMIDCLLYKIHNVNK
ncbi:MAG: hypothetical protein IKF90_23905 [Parasporobacterium sp.]|nr:hypothetical protein [Parasporobacterium sp.]